MTEIDTSRDAVERMAHQLTMDAPLGKKSVVAETIRALLARAEKAEAENATLRTEKHADAEAIASARNDALREAMTICNRSYGKPLHHVHRDIAALIEGDTND